MIQNRRKDHPFKIGTRDSRLMAWLVSSFFFCGADSVIFRECQSTLGQYIWFHEQVESRISSVPCSNIACAPAFGISVYGLVIPVGGMARGGGASKSPDQRLTTRHGGGSH